MSAMNFGSALIVALGAVGLACSSSHPGPIAPPNVGIVGFEPGDGETQVTQIPAVVSIKWDGYSDPGYKELVAQISLRTWPELAPVAMTIRTSGEKGTTRHEIITEKPLAEGWYTFRVGALPAGYAWYHESPPLKLADGSVGSRFRIGSSPHLHKILRCSAPGKSPTVDLTFSEVVTNKGKLADIVRITTTDVKVSCTSLDGNATVFSTVTYGCPGLAKDASIDININAGLESRSARPVAPFAKALHVNAVDFGAWASDCSEYVVPFEPNG